MIKVASMQHML